MYNFDSSQLQTLAQGLALNRVNRVEVNDQVDGGDSPGIQFKQDTEMRDRGLGDKKRYIDPWIRIQAVNKC